MAKKAYVGVSGTPQNITKIYVGVGGVPKKVIKGYVGVGGVPRLFWDGGDSDTLNIGANVSIHDDMDGALNVSVRVSIRT